MKNHRYTPGYFLAEHAPDRLEAPERAEPRDVTRFLAWCKEAAGVLLRYGLDSLGLQHPVWALVHIDNAPSLRLAARLGFLPVGEGHHYNGPHRVHVALPGQA